MNRLLLFGFLFALLTSVLISCQKELSLETDQNLGHGTLYDSFKTCQPMVPNGTYYNGVSASRDTNYVKVIITITQTGSYILNTGMINGFGFSDSGYFSKLGVDTLLLQAYGSPILNVPTDFTLRLDSTVCGFTIDVQDSTGTGLGGTGVGVITGDSSFVDPNPAATNTWHLTDSTTGKSYSGIFNAASIIPPGFGYFSHDTLVIAGQATSTSDSIFLATLVIPSLNITPGIYPVNAGNTVNLGIASTNEAIYLSNNETAEEGTGIGNSYITITSYSNNQLAGSFHTYAKDADGTLVLLAGSFNCTVR